MSQNFDCTQMISFDRSLVANLNDDSFQDFERLGFSLVLDENIRDVKKEYFFFQEDEYFIEFSNDFFCGEFEDWYEFNEPPQLILDFCNALISCANKNKIDFMKVYLSFFAEKGYSSDHYS
ncbi:hypothetical protein, partial [Salinivibrio sp. ML290]|uniref:hypothetical protein n=1 Tax=Salinivibrio sp. ML290 TaxID=1909468 RepID=UPI0009887A2B